MVRKQRGDHPTHRVGDQMHAPLGDGSIGQRMDVLHLGLDGDARRIPASLCSIAKKVWGEDPSRLQERERSFVGEGANEAVNEHDGGTQAVYPAGCKRP
jgi:hypothetical protein